MTTQIAIIADIHGNIWALDAVLKDIERRGIGHVVNLGDSLYGSLEWAATADRLMKSNIVSISGNQDVEIHAPTEAIQKSADHQRAMRELSAEHIYWLAALPFTYVVDEVFCCHGTPTSDTTYMLEKVTPHGVFLNDNASILGNLHGVEHRVVVCGHSHQARTVWLPNGQLVINPGSVGMPAYDDDLPYPHVMEAGSPHARYAILTHRENDWGVEHIALPYNWYLAAAMAREHGREDRAQWLESGRATLPAK